MDPGRYGPPQGWDNNSALEGYGAAHEPRFRFASSFDERRFIDDRYAGENIYPRNGYPRDNLERDNYSPPTSDADFWPHSRRRNYEGEYPLERASRRHDSYNDFDECQESDKFRDGDRAADNYRDHRFEHSARSGGRDRDDYGPDGYWHKPRTSYQHGADSRERDYGYDHLSYDSDYDRGHRRDNSRKRDYRDPGHDKRRSSNRERGHSPHGRYERSQSRSRSRSRSCSRSWSRGRDDRLRSRSPYGRSRSRSHSHREGSFDDGRYGRRRDRDEKRRHEYYAVAPSATVVVKGLSQKTTEEDLYQMLAEWGPLRHVRVIKERNSGLSRGFAFIDFPSVGAAQVMMDQIGDDGLVVGGRKVFFEYSSKPTAESGTFNEENQVKSGHSNHRNMIVPSDWICIICGCINFARRTSCFQCNEPRSDDAPTADAISASQAALGKRGSETGPTHVLVVRGLDENADEEMLRYEFSKHAPIKDLRLVRDKFTHVSRGFAFVHFYSVEEATKALEATNGTALEKNGQILRVAYAKSVLRPGSGAAASSQPSSLAAAAIEAAAFAQQYDAVGWAPKEYNPDDKQTTDGQGGGEIQGQKNSPALQSGFVWDEASGYYYDAASGFYYDGTTGLYYDGNNGIWYSFDHQTQQYVPCTDQNNTGAPSKRSEPSRGTDGSSSNRKVVISAPAATIMSAEKADATSLPDAVQAAAAAAAAAEKKEKEKMKEIKLASKSSILANKKKMSNVLTMWKQRTSEGQATRVALDGQLSDDKDKSFANHILSNKKENSASGSGVSTSVPAYESPVKPRPVSNSSGGSLMGVIRSSGRAVGISDAFNLGSCDGASESSAFASTGYSSSLLNNGEAPMSSTPFKTDASALGSCSTSATGSGKRRFSELPLSSASSNHRDQPHTGYRDRAAERRSLYGSSSATDVSDLDFADSNRDVGVKKSSLDSSMPFPPGVGGGRGAGDPNIPSYEVITADKAIDESNVGNRMLRSMGWQEGAGLGKDGSGMIEPVQAQAVESRAGLGSHQKKKVVDPSLEAKAGDSYRTLIHKKAIARFREMS